MALKSEFNNRPAVCAATARSELSPVLPYGSPRPSIPCLDEMLEASLSPQEDTDRSSASTLSPELCALASSSKVRGGACWHSSRNMPLLLLSHHSKQKRPQACFENPSKANEDSLFVWDDGYQVGLRRQTDVVDLTSDTDSDAHGLIKVNRRACEQYHV